MNRRVRSSVPPADGFSGYDIPYLFAFNLILFAIFRGSYYIGLAGNAYIRRTWLSYLLIGASVVFFVHTLYLVHTLTAANLREKTRPFLLHGLALFGWYILCLPYTDYQAMHFAYMAVAAIHSALFWWQVNRVAAGIKIQAEEFRRRAAAKNSD